MSIKKILVPLSGQYIKDHSLLDVAIDIALDCRAHLLGVHVSTALNDVLPYVVDAGVGFSVALDMTSHFEQSLYEEKKFVRSFFLEKAEKSGMAVLKHDEIFIDPPSASFLAQKSDEMDNGSGLPVLDVCLSDLVVFSATYETSSMEWMMFESVLLEMRRPVLIVPKDKRITLRNNTVIIAWDGSINACQAILKSLAFLKNAESLILLTIATEKQNLENKINQTKSHEVMSYLRLHGVESRVVIEHMGEKKNMGAFLLSYVKKYDSNLLVMGGYGHSRLREALFGGVTQYIRLNTDIPILMAY